ncbi:MAG: alpha/beta hydrolase [Oscillibacter sp.]|nr:alpha/beta hydrolase [Oscillibacter sp.]
MERKSAPGTMPFADTSTLSAVRQGQSDFGTRVGRLGRKVIRDEREAGIFFEPSQKTVDLTALYLHGGGYVSGDGEYERGVAALLAEKLGVRLCAADYRLAPEYPYPAAVDDAEQSYAALLDAGNPPEKLVVIGDSSGGGLCFALLVRLKEKKLPMPAAVIALSPWCDLTMEAYRPDATDGMLDVPLLKSWAESYRGEAELRSPELSPVFGDLSGFPPTLILAGSAELLRADAKRMTAALNAAGVSAELTEAPDQGHTYPLTGSKQARVALSRMREFLAQIEKRSEAPEGAPPRMR